MVNENKFEILDIHTHKFIDEGCGIVNYPLFKVSLSPKPSTESFRNRVEQEIEFLRLWVEADSKSMNELEWGMLCKRLWSIATFYSVGIHPWELVDADSEDFEKRFRMFAKLSISKMTVAIGEVGLDKLAKAPIEEQIGLFQLMVEASEASEKPLIIHCVKAMDELLKVRKEMAPKQHWIWHGFRGKPEQAQQLLNQGFYISFGQHYHEEALAMVPDDRLFLETDDAEVDIECILEKAAEVRGVESDILRQTLRENIQKVFFKG